MHLLVYKVIMPAMSNDKNFETLDPEDWGKMRSLAHKMVDDAVDYLETVGDKPVWQPVPQAIKLRPRYQAEKGMNIRIA